MISHGHNVQHECLDHKIDVLGGDDKVSYLRSIAMHRCFPFLSTRPLINPRRSYLFMTLYAKINVRVGERKGERPQDTENGRGSEEVESKLVPELSTMRPTSPGPLQDWEITIEVERLKHKDWKRQGKNDETKERKIRKGSWARKIG